MATPKTVNYAIRGPDNVLRPGTIEVELSQSCTIPGAGGSEVVPSRVLVRSGTGTGTLSLYSTNDLTPNNTFFTVILRADDGGVETLKIQVPQTAGPFELADLVTIPPTASPSPARVSALTVDGLSTLGKATVDANGNVAAGSFTAVPPGSVGPYVQKAPAGFYSGKLFQYLREAFIQKTNVVNPQPLQPVVKVALSPAQVAAGAKAVTQTLAVPAIQAGDSLVGVQKAAQQAGLELVGWDIPSAGNLDLSFSNPTGAPITPTAAETYILTVNRQSQSAPAIVLGASGGATSIAGSALVTANSGKFLYTGAGTMGFGAGFPDTHFYAPRTPFTLTDSPTGLQQFIVHFMFDGDQFEIITKGLVGGKYRIKVDGMWIQPTSVLGPNTGDGADWRIWVNFGSVAKRRIQIYANGGAFPFGGIQCLPTYTIWPPSALPFRAIFFGDSEVFSSSDGVGRTWGEVCSDMLGWGDQIISSVGSTGFLQASTKTTFRGRVANDLIAMAPDIAVIMGGQNDFGNFTNVAVQAEVTLFLQTIQAALPACVLYGLGPAFYPGGANAANQAAFNTAMAAGYAAATSALYPAGVPFFDTVNDTTGRWFTGTGKVGATNGTGNSDFYIANDGIHPSQAGHDYIGLRVASSILAQLTSP